MMEALDEIRPLLERYLPRVAADGFTVLQRYPHGPEPPPGRIVFTRRGVYLRLRSFETLN